MHNTFEIKKKQGIIKVETEEEMSPEEESDVLKLAFQTVTYLVRENYNFNESALRLDGIGGMKINDFNGFVEMLEAKIKMIDDSILSLSFRL